MPVTEKPSDTMAEWPSDSPSAQIEEPQVKDLRTATILVSFSLPPFKSVAHSTGDSSTETTSATRARWRS